MQSITWLTDEIFWDAGFHTSIAINDNGIIVGVHESSDTNNNNLHYRIGHLRNPQNGDYTIQWDSGHGGINYDAGTFTFVYRDWSSPNPQPGQFTVHDKYSDTNSADDLNSDQFQKFADFNGRMSANNEIECDLFSLNWTLTGNNAIKPVWEKALDVNPQFALAMNNVQRNQYGYIPNILSLDFHQTARVTDTAISMTERFLNQK
jgi:hypothetical protein